MKPTDGFSVRQTFGPGGLRYEVDRTDRSAPPPVSLQI
jgi:hypothetical protein